MQSTYRHQTFTEKAMIVLALAVLALVLWKLVGLLLLIFGAVVGACILQTCMVPLLKWGVPRWLSLLIVVVTLTLVLAGISVAFGSQVASELESLSTLLPEAWEQLQERLQGTPLEPLMENAGERAGSVFENGLAQVGMVVVSMGGSLVNFFALIVGMVYFAAQPDVYRRGLLLLAPVKSRDKLAEALDKSGKALRFWLGGQLVAMVVTGLLVGVSMWLLGVPAPLGLGLIAGVLDFVPLVGPLIAAIPALLLAYTVSPQTALFVLIAYTIIQQIEGNVMQPLVQQRAVNLPPAMLLFSLFAASTLFGVAGVLLAAPLTVIGFVLINALYVQRDEDDEPVNGEQDKSEKSE
ncbi:AI-2E family transporter [Vreelandella sp. TE19]